MNIEDELMQILSEEIAKEVDQSVMEDILKMDFIKQGWVKAPFTSKDVDDIATVAAWIHLNTIGEYRIFGREFWFQRGQDLTAFILKWS